MKREMKMGTPYTLEGRLPMHQALPLGMQHVLAMFVGNLTPLMIICGICGITSEEPALYVTLLQNAMLAAGVITLIQLWSIGPVGGQVPVIMGTSSGFLGVMKGVAANPAMGGGIVAYSAIVGAAMVGGVCEAALGFFIKPLRKFFPPVVTGSVVLAIGLSLISVGVNSFAGGSGAKDFGSLPNLLLGLLVLAVIVAVVVLGGVRRIGQVTSLLVPFMAAFYILAGVVVYAILVVAMRILRAEDLKTMPHGERLAKLLHLR